MNSIELKCIELLFRDLVSPESNLEKEIEDEFNEQKIEFKRAKTNLFNLISINNFLANKDTKATFKKEQFLKSGIIPGHNDKEIPIPVIEKPQDINYNDFYKYLEEALEDGNYIFDNQGNIIISSNELTATVPGIWMYYLSSALKKDNYSKFCFFNKHDNIKITNPNELRTYLKHVKSFRVDIQTPDPNANPSEVVSKIENEINSNLNRHSEVRTEDLIDTLVSRLPKEYTIKIGKYKIDNYPWLITKANQTEDFYNKSLEEQIKLLNEWLINYLNNNEKSNTCLAKYLLTGEYKKEDKPLLISALFNNYISLLSSLNLDYDSISLRSFNIEEYLSDETIKNKLSLLSLRNQRKYIEAEFQRKNKDIQAQLELLDSINVIDEARIEEHSREYNHLQSDRLIEEKSLKTLDASIIKEQQELDPSFDIENIRFNNNLIMELISRCCKEGIFHVTADSKHLQAQIYNEQLGTNIFRATITIPNLLQFIEDTNYDLTTSLLTPKPLR